MPRRLLILIGLALALPAPALAQEATIVSRDVPLAGERTLAAAGAAGPLRPGRPPLARLRDGAVPDALDRAGAGAPGRKRRPRPRTVRTPARPSAPAAAAGGSATRGGSGRPTGSSTGCAGRSAACAPGSSPAPPPACRRERCRRRGRRRSCRAGLEGGREDPPRGPVVRSQSPARDRPSHGRRERLHRGPGAGDRQGDPALPREGERLERHRLQLPRRPLRHRLRGPLRRDGAKRRRRARGGIQHRLRRCRRARRVQLAGGRGEGAQLARRAARVAARRRARRPRVDAVVHLRRQRPLRRRPARLPAHGLRPSRHRLHRLPRHGALQPAQLDRRRGLARSGCRSSMRRRSAAPSRHGALPGEAVRAAAVDRRRLRRVRERRRVLAGDGRQRRLDVGRDDAAARQLHVRDSLRRQPHAGRRRDRRRRHLARDRGPLRRSRRRSRRTATRSRTPRRSRTR